VIWALAASTFGYAFFQRVAPSVMVADLMRDFAVGAAVLGNLSAIYFYSYSALQIPIGALLDRWGPRAMISISIAVAAVGSLLFATATTIALAYFGRLLVGVGSAVAFVGTLTLVARWFPANRFAFLSGMTMMVAMVSAVGSQALLSRLVAITGWRTLMTGGAGVAAVLAAAIWLVVRDRPGTPAQRAADGARIESWSELRRGVMIALGSWRLWNIALLGASLTGPLLTFAGLWGVPYLKVRYGLNTADAASINSLMFIGWAIGAPVAGWLSDHIGRRKPPLMVAAFLNTALLAAMILIPSVPLGVMMVLIFLTGAAGAGMVSCLAVAKEITSPRIHGAVIGLVNCITVSSGALLQPVVGLVLDRFWDGTMENGARVYGLADYRIALGVIVAFAALALITSLLSEETRCQPVDADRQV